MMCQKSRECTLQQTFRKDVQEGGGTWGIGELTTTTLFFFLDCCSPDLRPYKAASFRRYLLLVSIMGEKACIPFEVDALAPIVVWEASPGPEATCVGDY